MAHVIKTSVRLLHLRPLLFVSPQVPLMEKAGRRPLLLGGMLLMIISAVTITVALILEDSVSWMSYVSIVCIIATVIGFAIGLGEWGGQTEHLQIWTTCTYEENFQVIPIFFITSL